MKVKIKTTITVMAVFMLSLISFSEVNADRIYFTQEIEILGETSTHHWCEGEGGNCMDDAVVVKKKIN